MQACWKKGISTGIVDHAALLRRQGAPSLVAALRAIIEDAERIISVQTGEPPRARKTARRAGDVPDAVKRAALR